MNIAKKISIIMLISTFLISLSLITKTSIVADVGDDYNDEEEYDLTNDDIIQNVKQDKYDEQYGVHYGTFNAKMHLASSKQYTMFPIVYSDDVFFNPTTTYNHFLARMSLGLAITSFETELYTSQEYTFAALDDYFYACEFNNVRTDDYDKETSLYTVGTMMGNKKIEKDGEEFTLIAVAIRSGKYSKEWMSNLTVGYFADHEGFNSSSILVTDRILSYIAQLNIEGKFKIWITGFSRGAAIANLAAKKLNDVQDIGKENVFAYTFATPRNTVSEDFNSNDYNNIFNVLGASDVVTQFAPSDWGFNRYGINYYLPGQEFDTDFFKYYSVVQEQMNKFGFNSYYNPDLNLRMRIFIGLLTEFLEDRIDYTDYLQEKLISILDEKTINNIVISIKEIIQYYDADSRSNTSKIDNVINFLKTILPPVFTGKGYMTNQVNSSANTLFNIMHEHFPEMYLLMMYNFDESMFSQANDFSYILLAKNAQYKVVDDSVNETIFEVDLKGNQTYSEYARSNQIELAFNKYGQNYLLTLPHDHDYRIEYTSNTNKQLEYQIINVTRNVTHKNEGYKATIKTSKGTSGTLVQIKDGSVVVDTNLQSAEFDNSKFAETLGLYKKGLNWRLSITIIIFLFAIFICIGPIICYLIYVLINKKKFKFLTVINITVFTAICFECELSYWIFSDTPIIHILWEIVLAIIAIHTYVINHRLKGVKLFDTLLPLLICLSISAIFINRFIIIGCTFFGLGLIYLAIFMLRKAKPNNVLIMLMIIVTVLSELTLIPVLKSHRDYAIIFMVLTPGILLVVFNSLIQEPKFEKTTLLLILSIILLYVSLVSINNVVPHLIAHMIFSACLIAYATFYGDKYPKKEKTKDIETIEEINPVSNEN